MRPPGYPATLPRPLPARLVRHHRQMATYPDSIEQRLANVPPEYATSARELLPTAAELYLPQPSHRQLYVRVLDAVLDQAAGDPEVLRSLCELAKTDWRDVLANQELRGEGA